MTSVNRIGWFVIAVLVSLAMWLGMCSVARADESRLGQRVAELVPRFGARGVELVEPGAFGNAVAEACGQERECVAKLLTMAVLESGLRASVARSEYAYHEGDAYTDRYGVRQHRAWGTYQLHRSRLNDEVWGDDDLLVQARAARRAQQGAELECRGFRSVAPELGMWRVLSGRGCLAPYSGEAARMTLLAKIRRAL